VAKLAKYSTVMYLIGQIQYSYLECYVNRTVDIRTIGNSDWEFAYAVN